MAKKEEETKKSISINILMQSATLMGLIHQGADAKSICSRFKMKHGQTKITYQNDQPIDIREYG